jgi:hypothetical protein
MNEATIKGTIIKFGQIQTGSGQNGVWKKREVIIESNGQYPKKVCLTAWGKVCDSLSNHQTGDHVNLLCHVESREYNEKWYTEIKPFKTVED